MNVDTILNGALIDHNFWIAPAISPAAHPSNPREVSRLTHFGFEQAENYFTALVQSELPDPTTAAIHLIAQLSCKLTYILCFDNNHSTNCFAYSKIPKISLYSVLPRYHCTQWEESFFPKTSVAIVILFRLKWAGYLAVVGLNLLAQISDRISPSGV